MDSEIHPTGRSRAVREDINYNRIIDGAENDAAQAAADRAANLPADEIDPTTFYVTQQYARYSDENHEVWESLYRRRWEVLEEQASRVFINGLNAIKLVPDRVPLLYGEAPDPRGREQTIKGINEYLRPLTGWQSNAVPGYLPAKAFFACLAKRDFPTTITIRPKDRMDYLPEPDIFHDVFGHVPLHADPVFAEFLQTYGQAALMCEDPDDVERLGRLFWFTVEFGLIKEDGRLKLYGSGLISSHGEAKHALESPEVERRPFDLDRVCETTFEIDHYQPILYVLESFEQLRDAMNGYAERVLGKAGAKS
ncbi:MAG: phenylalanine 4-monooxygenase [Phycisphaerales bacterium]|nr:MAG: phenylalanine 4-monooxygenase [Phycisphaerales bacterium]